MQTHLRPILLLLMFSVISPLHASPSQTSFYVSPTGNDAFAGTLLKPFRTISRARNAVRNVNENMRGDIHVYLRGGTYVIASPIVFGSRDSGTNGHEVIYGAYRSELPVISGGVPVTGWKQYTGSIYMATLNRDTKLRNLFVDGQRADMTSKAVQGLGAAGTFTVAGTEPWAQTAGSGPDGVAFSATNVGVYRNPEDVELDQPHTWSALIVCARDMVAQGDRTVVQLQQPYGVIAATMESGTGLNPSGRFTIRNAFELLNKPGEFYFDRGAHTLYYNSRGEDMATAHVIAPVSEGLLQIAGTSNADRAQNLVFHGIKFECDDWQLEDVAGSHAFAGVQSASLYVKYRKDGDFQAGNWSVCDTPQATVDVRNASGIRFERDVFAHLSSGTAISFVNDVVDSTVTGNLFNDLAGNAVSVGHPQHDYTASMSTVFPPDVWGVCTNDTVADNTIRNVSSEFSQEEAISAFYVNGLHVLHNDILDAPYGSIAVGWGWSGTPKSTTCGNNIIGYNKIVASNRVLRDDGGPIYTLGNQPGSEIIGNYVVGGPRQIYTDEGSAYLLVKQNVLENAGENGAYQGNSAGAWYNAWASTIHDIVIDNNYTSTSTVNDYGTHCPITNTHLETLPWPSDAQAIIAKAGLEPGF